tara:strand:+ start:432 stop:641 length:210 start_codon:yes stop_codon:yes gene_type:complete
MISSLVGAVIMSGVTVAMLLAITVSDNALKKVGKYPLTKQERQLLRDAGFNSQDIKDINTDIRLINFNK